MVTSSTRFALDKYSAGEDGWSHSDLVDHVDEHSVETDTKANRPASGDYDQEVFLAVDEATFYIWDESATAWDAVTPPSVATGTVTASGGSSPAVSTTLADVFTSQTQPYQFTVYVDADPSFDADYAFDWSYDHQWDDSDSAVDIALTVNWVTDPGSSNDVTLRWRATQV